MKKRIFLLFMLTMGLHAIAQQTSLRIDDYVELSDGKPHDGSDVWNKMSQSVAVQWGTTDVRYKKLDVPTLLAGAKWKATAWKGERVNGQAVLWTKEKVKNLRVSVGDLKCGKSVISADAVSANFVRYVMGDQIASKDNPNSACGGRSNFAEWDSLLVADMIDVIPVRNVEAMTTQPIWISVWIPSDCKAGKYKGVITLSADNMKEVQLPYEIQVINRILPAPSEWSFHLDLWQNPYSVARFHNVPLWSKEHFDALLPVMKKLASAGQKVITATIMNRPWNGQTEDEFNSMILKKKNIDGSWSYDYTVFDKWVEFMMNEVGIKQQINCYSMIPWALQFDYLDMGSNTLKYMHAQPGEAAYADYWGSFLKDFAAHLKSKGWFEKTTIAMDERGPEVMKEALKLIRQADPNFKISLAGNYYPDIQNELYDLCLAYGQTFPEDVLKQRKAEGKKSTVYTCCAEVWPNTFMLSEPAEAVCLGWHAISWNYDGYLRWAYNSWTKQPLHDARFRTWSSGDCYIVYPAGRSSIRMERLIEGIQDYEKIRILKEEFLRNGKEASLRKLEKAISVFRLTKADRLDASKAVSSSRAILNSF